MIKPNFNGKRINLEVADLEHLLEEWTEVKQRKPWMQREGVSHQTTDPTQAPDPPSSRYEGATVRSGGHDSVPNHRGEGCSRVPQSIPTSSYD